MSSRKLNDGWEKIGDLKQLLAFGAKEYAERVAFVYQNVADGETKSVTYREFEREVAQAAIGLLQILRIQTGAREGKKVAILAPNSYDWALAYLAIVNTQQIVVPMDWQLPVTDLINLLKRANVQAIIFGEEVTDKMIEIKKNFNKISQYICLGKSEAMTMTWQKVKAVGWKNWAARKADYFEKKIYADTLSTLIFTSGTTSLPKGIMLSHRTFMQSVLGMAHTFGMQAEIYLSLLPLYHIYEFECGLLLQLLKGSTIYYLPGGVRKMTENLQRVRPTWLFLVPLLVEGAWKRIEALAAEGKSHAALVSAAKKYFGGRLKAFGSAGAALNPKVAEKFAEVGITSLQGYGISENSACIAFNSKQHNKFASVGKPIATVKVKIGKINENGVGEIWVRGKTAMLGYYKDEKKTDGVMEDGWLDTGDYGYFDEDGFLYVSGRKKNVIISKNAKNVYPEEIEFLLNNEEGIAESLVYGKVVTDDVEVAALIVPDNEKIAELHPNWSGIPDAKKIKNFLSKKIESVNQKNVPYKAIRDFQIVAGLPKTASGKMKR